jgi:four helix bundle protein
MAFKSVEQIRAWHVTRVFKKPIYDLTDKGSLARDRSLRDQLRNAAASAPSNISEGFGRLDPGDFARLVRVARASLVECQNHLVDAVDRGHITEDVRRVHSAMADEALREMGGLHDYLQSPEARRNAERIRQRRSERRRLRRNPEP